VIANGENSAGGVGITATIFDELMEMGIDLVTTGNHVWDKKEIFNFIDSKERLIRPANYPPRTPGKGYQIVQKSGKRIGVINLAGRIFMPPIDCLFRQADDMLTSLQGMCDIIIVDFHAETTSEKMALGWYLDGKVSCVVGTHTHVQTADERILPQGTAYISDLGMVGPVNSVLGVEKNVVVKKFLTGLPVRFTVAGGPTQLCAVLVKIDEKTNRPISITRLREYFDL
jgi:metallophosphoesterase (TIGR00282 family)